MIGLQAQNLNKIIERSYIIEPCLKIQILDIFIDSYKMNFSMEIETYRFAKSLIKSIFIDHKATNLLYRQTLDLPHTAS